MKKVTEDGYIRTNREMSKEPHIRGGFCWTCDIGAPAPGVNVSTVERG